MIKSLRLRVSLLLIFAVTLSLAGFGFYGHQDLVGQLNENFATIQQATASRIAKVAATPLWEVNEDALANSLRAQLDSPDVEAVSVQDVGGTTTAAFERDTGGKIVAAKEIRKPNALIVEKPIFRSENQAERIGTVAVRFTRARLDATIQRNAYSLVLQVLAVDVVLILLLLASLRIVFRPLAELRDALMQLAGQERGGQAAITELPEGQSREFAGVARGFNLVLRRIREEGQQQEAVLSGKARAGELSQRLQQANDYAEFGRQLLGYLTSWLGADIGVFFVKDEASGEFQCFAGFGVDPSGCKPFKPGEGMAGEAAASGQVVTCRDLPESSLRIHSGLVSAQPRTVSIVPVTGSRGVIAVLELAYLHEPQYREEIRSEAIPVIAFSLELLMGKRATLTLLGETQLQAAKLAEQQEELKATEAWFRGIVETAPDGMIVTDERGSIILANPQIEAMFGYATGELQGRMIETLVPRQIRERHPGLRQGFLREGGSRPMAARNTELRGVRKDGSEFPVEVGLSLLPARGGRGVCACASVRNITERKLAEAELLRAKQAAEDATRAKSDFLANMSHEIRTPMNAIIGMSHLALQTNLDKKQRNYVEKSHRAAENLLGIINDILDFSKIEAGKMTTERIDFRLEDVMEHLANLVGMKAEDKGLELLFSTAPDVPTALVGDPLRLGQVLVNLGNNAVKFTEKGEIVVGAEKIAQHGAEVELHFWVRDSGIGMTAEQTGRMFQAFSQADSSTTRKYGGTGLGLTISKSLVENMAGRIWVESEPGKGSTFHFHARFGLQAEPMARRMFRAEELLGVRVLVVDDNASAREILSTMARGFGLEVDVAWDGNQALRMIAEAERKTLPYDLVLMDWKMPVMDGVETVRRIQTEKLARVPAVIMVTAYGREEALGSAAQQGVQLKSVLTKPVTSSTLLEAIGETLGKGSVAETRVQERSTQAADAIAKLKGARVLLVEDNDLNQELAIDLLGNAGMEVVLAKHGQEALDVLARDSRFDGILMDCQMPVMDGYTATREIRSNPAWQKLPIVAMTANAMAGDREKVIEAGMLDHIPKPLNAAEMFVTIAKWIRPAQHAEKTAATKAPQGAAPDGLAPLPGVDVKAGLATTLQDEKLYRRLLAKFRDAYGTFAETFRAAQGDADASAATRAAHTLRGAAGTIGAKAVQAAAGELEAACRDGASSVRIDELLARTLAELSPVTRGLEKLGAGDVSAPVGVAAALDEPRARALKERLKSLLEDNDTEATDTVEEFAELASGTPLSAALKRVASAVEKYDFDAALKALEQVKV